MLLDHITSDEGGETLLDGRAITFGNQANIRVWVNKRSEHLTTSQLVTLAAAAIYLASGYNASKREENWSNV